MIAHLRNATGGIKGLEKVEKIYLDNINLIYNLASENANIGNIRETFFFNQLRARHEIIVSPVADFLVGDYTFEVGGKTKESDKYRRLTRLLWLKVILSMAF